MSLSICRDSRLFAKIFVVVLLVSHLYVVSAKRTTSSSSSSTTVETRETIVTKGVDNTKETMAIKNKLATAEGRVGDLISRLDSVSDDATRARSEIHNTLLEVWNVVDLLGKDQCGAVVEKSRIAQTKAEARVTELTDEIRLTQQEIETLKVQLAKRDDIITSLRTELKAERTRRETIENEARALRDKLHWASAVSNETEKYELVAERLQKLLVIVSERTILLKRISTMVLDAHEGFNDWQTEVKALSVMVRESERQFSGSYKGDAVDGLNRQISDLQVRLKNALSSRSDMQRERDDIRSRLGVLEERTSQRNIEYATTMNSREPIIRRYDPGVGGSWMGWVTFLVVSVGTGVVATVLFNVWGQRGSTQGSQPNPQSDAAKFGFAASPGQQQARVTPEPVGRASMSPLTFVPGSGSRTPGSRGSTPRRY